MFTVMMFWQINGLGKPIYDYLGSLWHFYIAALRKTDWLTLVEIYHQYVWMVIFFCRITPFGEPPTPRAAHVATAVGTMVVIQVCGQLAFFQNFVWFIRLVLYVLFSFKHQFLFDTGWNRSSWVVCRGSPCSWPDTTKTTMA